MVEAEFNDLEVFVDGFFGAEDVARVGEEVFFLWCEQEKAVAAGEAGEVRTRDILQGHEVRGLGRGG